MSGPKPKVLFVDDEESILKAFKLNLGRKYSVFIAESGSEGLRIIEEDGPFESLPLPFQLHQSCKVFAIYRRAVLHM